MRRKGKRDEDFDELIFLFEGLKWKWKTGEERNHPSIMMAVPFVILNF